MMGLVVISISFRVPAGPVGESTPSNFRLPLGGFKNETSVPTGAEDMAICWAVSSIFPGDLASCTPIFASERTMEALWAIIWPMSIDRDGPPAKSRPASLRGIMGPARTMGYPCLPTKTSGGDSPSIRSPILGKAAISSNLLRMGHTGRPQNPLPLQEIHWLIGAQ